jgi:20S proteasome subunit alpha 2
MKNAKTFLEKRYNPDVDIDDAVHTALLTLKEGFDGEMTPYNIEVGVITPDKEGNCVFKLKTPDEIKDYFKEL